MASVTDLDRLRIRSCIHRLVDRNVAHASHPWFGRRDDSRNYWVSTAYIVGMVLVMPLTGFLGALFGTEARISR